VTQNKLYEELTQTHNERERELISESENERKKNRKLHTQLQTITQRFVLLQDFVKDVAPDAQLPQNATMKSLELNDMNDMTRKMQQHDEKLKEKIASLERDVEKEKRAHVNTAERAQIQQEGIQKELLSLKRTLREEHSDCDPMSHKLKIEYQENINKLKALQATLDQQIRFNSSNERTMQSQNMNKSQMFETQISSMQNQIQSMNEENASLRSKLKQAAASSGANMKRRSSSKHEASLNVSMDNSGGGGSAADVTQYQKQIHSLKKKYKENDAKHKKQLKDLSEKISQLEASQGESGSGGGGGGNDGGGGGDSNKLWAKIKAVEKEKTQLMAKYAALEAEYKTMEAHYKKEIQKYKKLVLKYKNKAK